MALPPRVYFTITEAAARWGSTYADIAAWSVAGELAIATAIPPVTCGEEVIAGLVQISAADIFPMFRRCGSGPGTAPVRRVRPLDRPDAEWLFITEPEGGLLVSFADLVITAREAQRFEEAHDIFRRPPAGPGPDPRYSWHEMLQWLVIRIHERGVPETQKELLDDCRQWFIDRSSDGEHPTERSLRRYISPIWRELRKEDA